MVARKRKEEGNWLLPEPFEEYTNRLNRYLDRLFFAPARYLEAFAETPDVDLIDEGDHFTIRADLPGVKKEDIKLKVNKDNVPRKRRRKKGRTIITTKGHPPATSGAYLCLAKYCRIQQVQNLKTGLWR